MKKFLAVFAAFCCLSGSAAEAQRQGPQVVGHIAGHRCMMLNLPPDLQNDENYDLPVLAAPRRGAPRIGIGSATMIAADPPKTVAGFMQVLHLDGQSGWVEHNKIKPWFNPHYPTVRCIPAMMANGRPGFDYTRP